MKNPEILKKVQDLLPKVAKPAQYCGNEMNCIYKNREEAAVRFAFCFPDTYEIGMSHLGMKILYSVLNNREEFWCERVFAPMDDMEEAMRKEKIPLFALESYDPVKDFDIIGFTLQYELSFTNVLNMLNLAGVPLLSSQRDSLSPLVVAGGPCVCNPEPMADFIDLFMPGEGEEVILELCDCYADAKKRGLSKQEFLQNAAKIPGIYVPSLYEITYHEDGTIRSMTAKGDAPLPVEKRVIEDFDQVYYPEKFVVPYTQTVHDRAVLEVLRGCIRGCRFCQAGFIYRPFREKNFETLNKQGKSLCDSTGYDELGLSSLSTTDYAKLDQLLDALLGWTEKEKINLSLPSLRIDNFSEEMLQKTGAVRKSGLTFAPEAGTQRLRDAINKNITERDILRTAEIAFLGGHSNIKLYFMIGLPTETDEDIIGIAETAQKVVDLFYALPNRPKGKSVRVSVTVSGFVPKPFTPFEFEPQNTREELKRKQALLRSHIGSKKISVSYHDSYVTVLEGIFARGDRRLGKLLLSAYEKGCKFDSWDDHLKPELWQEALAECGIDPTFYANRRREYDEIFPWELLDYGVSKEFFVRENKKAHAAQTTANCRQQCAGCGANRYCQGGKCFG